MSVVINVLLTSNMGIELYYAIDSFPAISLYMLRYIFQGRMLVFVSQGYEPMTVGCGVSLKLIGERHAFSDTGKTTHYFCVATKKVLTWPCRFWNRIAE